ncbi:peptidylprolyl isomerase [Meiothermus sp.]|uniref:peptidylprolyl isomerase n=1 Tax=Meiothermus sp. TaxID=1955249 RepID=UPI002624B0F0|nr:peptidylprolyl isomerase [Meiothermus sp.]
MRAALLIAALLALAIAAFFLWQGNGGAKSSLGGKMEALPYKSDQPVTRFARPEQVIDPTKFDYYAEIETSKGKIGIDLFENEAPITVNSFVFLALHRYFEGVVFHRVIPGFVAQTGDPTGTGMGGPGYQFGLEVTPKLNYDKKGLLGMARTMDPNSNGSQFFITYGPTPNLNQQYTIFGQVVEGMGVVERIAPTEGPQASRERDKILSVKIFARSK